MRLYRNAGWEIVWKHSRYINHPLSLFFDRMGAHLLAGDDKGHVILLSVANGERVESVLNVSTRQRAVALREDGQRFVAVDFEGRLFQDLVSTATEVPYRHTHASRVWAAALSPDDRCVVTAGADGTARVWNLDRPLAGEVVFSIKSTSLHQILSGDGQTIACHSNEQVDLWSVKPWKHLGTLPLSDEGVISFALSHDGGLIALGTRQGRVSLIETRSLREIKFWEMEKQNIHALAFQPRRSLLAALTSTAIHLLDPTNTKNDRNLSCNSASDMAFAPDGKSLAACQYDENRLTVWDFETGLQRFSFPDAVNRRIAYSPDGAQLAAVQTDGSIMVRNTHTGAVQSHLSGIDWTNRPSRIEFTADGSYVVIADGSRGARFVSLRAKQELFRANDSLFVTYVKFSPDGNDMWTSCNAGETCSLVRWSIDLPSAGKLSPNSRGRDSPPVNGGRH